jgi:hypothetical protein
MLFTACKAVECSPAIILPLPYKGLIVTNYACKDLCHCTGTSTVCSIIFLNLMIRICME